MNGIYNIDGVGSISGGEYQEFSIDGVGNVNGELKVKELDINGVGKFKGVVKAKSIEINGVAKFLEDTSCEKLQVDGSGNFKENLKVSSIVVNGSARVDKMIQGEKADIEGGLVALEGAEFDNVEVNGAFKTLKSLEVEEIKCDGILNIGDELNGEKIIITLKGASKIGTIGGHEIKVKKGSFYGSHQVFIMIKDLFSNETINYDGLICEEIEGDEIDIEHTKSKMVRGNNVVIGNNCEIGKVEYSESIMVSPSAKIREKIKIER